MVIGDVDKYISKKLNSSLEEKKEFREKLA